MKRDARKQTGKRARKRKQTRRHRSTLKGGYVYGAKTRSTVRSSLNSNAKRNRLSRTSMSISRTKGRGKGKGKKGKTRK